MWASGPRPSLRVLIAAAALLLGTSVGAQEALQIGGRVSVATDRLNVRDAPSTAGAVLATVSTGAKGTVVRAAPVDSDGHRWWLVQFDRAAGGWVAEGTTKEPFIAPAPPSERRMPRVPPEAEPCYASSGHHSCLIDRAEKMLYTADADLLARRAAYYRAQLGDYERMWELLNRDGAGGGYWHDDVIAGSGYAAMEAGLADWIEFNVVIGSAGNPTTWTIDYLGSKGELPAGHELAAADHYQRALRSEAWRAHKVVRGLRTALEEADLDAVMRYVSQLPLEEATQEVDYVLEDLKQAGRFEEVAAILELPGLFEDVGSERRSLLYWLLLAGEFSYAEELLSGWPELPDAPRMLAEAALKAGHLELALAYWPRVPAGERSNLGPDLIAALGQASRVTEAEGLFEDMLAESAAYFDRFGSGVQQRLLSSMAVVYYLNGAPNWGEALILSLSDEWRSNLSTVAAALAASDIPARSLRAQLTGLVDAFGYDAVIPPVLAGAIAAGDEPRVVELLTEFEPDDALLRDLVKWKSGTWFKVVSPYFRSDEARLSLAREMVIATQDWERQEYAGVDWIIDEVPGLPISSELRTLVYVKTGRLDAAYREAKRIVEGDK